MTVKNVYHHGVLRWAFLPILVFVSACFNDAPEEVRVDLYAAKQGDLVHFIETNGTIENKDLTNITTPFSGRLEALYVKEGDQVVRGQKLGLISSNYRVEMLDMALQKSMDDYHYWKKQILPAAIVAPGNGHIVELRFKVGEEVRGALGTLNKGEMVKADIDEVDLPKISLGQAVYIRFDIENNLEIKGKLTRISPGSKLVKNVNVYEVEIDYEAGPALAEQSFMPRIGMSVTVSFPTRDIKDAIHLPLRAVDGLANTELSVTLSDGQPRDIVLGEVYDERVHVKSGLKEGEKVAVKTKSFLDRSLRSPINIFKK